MWTLVLTLVALAARALAGEPSPGPLAPYSVDATTTTGYRVVDVGGSRAKYREDYNLQQGARLFALRVDGVSNAPETTRLDRFHLDVDTPGDEPVSHFRLSAADRSLYDLRVAFTRSKYFYAVPRLFEAPVAGDVRTDDLHDFNLVRTHGSIDLTVRPPNLPTLLVGYRLYEQHGDAITTDLLPFGDTFLLRAPVDTVTHVGRLGTEFRLLDADVLLAQEYRRVNRSLDRSGPVDAAGLDPTDASTLAFFRNDQDEHVDVPATTVRVRRSFGERVELTGDYLYSHADLTSDRTQSRRGTTDVPGVSETDLVRGRADARLDTHVADLSGTIGVTDHVHVHTSYRFDERSQQGHLDETSTAFGVLAARTGDHLRQHRVTGDLEVEPRADLMLRAGVRYSRRDANLSASGQDIGTDTLGAIGGLDYRPWSFTRLFARYENVQVDEPFRVPGSPGRRPPLPAREIALTFVNRATTGVHLDPTAWLSLHYQLNADSRENDTFGARGRAVGNNVGLTLAPLPDLTFFASYSRRDLDNRADILLTPLATRTTSLQNSTEDVFASELRYDFSLLRQRWTSGWNVLFVRSANTLRPRLEAGGGGRTVFDLDRVDGGAFLTWHWRLVEPGIEVRRIDYGERVLSANDYRATIVTLTLTKHLSF